MRVLHVFKTYLPDSFTGIERVIWEIAEGTHRLGVSSEVLSLSLDPRPMTVEVGHHLSTRARRDLNIASTGLSLSLLKLFRERIVDADVVHYHFPWPMMDLVHALARVRKPSIVTYHSDVVRQRALRAVYAPLMHWFLGSTDRIIATSQNYLESSSVLARYRSKTEVIPLGIGPRIDPPQELIDHWRSRVGSSFFLFVGELRYYKGIQFLLEAAQLSRAPVVVVGAGEFAQRIAASHLPNVVMVGRVGDPDKEALLSLCRAFVLPSHLRSEAFGVSLLEAARAGKAMISCELGTGTSYVNSRCETGFVVPPADPAALAEAMTTLWNDEALTGRFGAAARRRYEDKFRAEDMGAAYAALYRRLLERKA
jgi:glycosyltransferase involved in cell wall biosynthesis